MKASVANCNSTGLDAHASEIHHVKSPDLKDVKNIKNLKSLEDLEVSMRNVTSVKSLGLDIL